ncbi:hypothetical protein A9Y76_07175 [Ralstonia insidiosa]|uniref:Uncharacterized protein n=1 Tax=Ralstonia insidiosa TaxID=190721 RepID=A0A191ZVS9_9RALS|nr:MULTISPECIES: hypothetical protein [Burkholderiaceae]ANJ72260.1 hypothetical protein A9Y76_07175 [Ralstonia insidiosa]MBU9118381.1 hypothetical protein [Burkholderia multivorans]MBU9434175.1 hypothetical protein [Burkholderia multivorans]
MKQLTEIINSIQEAHAFIHDIIEYDSRYDLARFGRELLVIEKDEKTQSTNSFFYLSSEGKVVHEHAEGDADRFVEYYNNKEQLKLKMEYELEMWSKKYAKG